MPHAAVNATPHMYIYIFNIRLDAKHEIKIKNKTPTFHFPHSNYSTPIPFYGEAYSSQKATLNVQRPKSIDSENI